MTTLLTLLSGAAGALAGWWLNAPVYMLLGPAVAVTLTSLAGVRTGVDNRLRDCCFVILGVAVGGGFDSDALAAMIRWPLAFAVMGLAMWAILLASRALLVRLFGYRPKAAMLAGAPGHLSFVISVAADMGSDLARVSVAQSVRLLSLTLVVPFAALAMGMDVAGNIAPQGTLLTVWQILGIASLGLGLGLLFMRWGVPAPLLMGTMVVSALGHLTELTPGVLPQWLVLPAYLVLGSMIGTRFSGLSLSDLSKGLLAGVLVTTVAVVIAALAAVPVALALGMPAAHVLVAFSPGGLETMIAMGAMLGVVPGFVAACHIARLFVLTLLLPYMLAREDRRSLTA